MAPLAALMAWPTSPSEPATTSVAPLRLPTAIDACTALAGAVSVAGFCTLVNHCVAPWGVMPRYPPEVGVAALPSPTNTESRPLPVMSATDGVESMGTPRCSRAIPARPSPEARSKAYTWPARSPTTTAGTPGQGGHVGRRQRDRARRRR